MCVRKTFLSIYSYRSLNSTKTCSKVRNSVFAKHCTVDTLGIVYTGGHAVAISRIHGVTPSTTSSLTDRQNFTNISENVSEIKLSIGVRGGHRC